jgi:hypothetical protein
MEGVNRQSQHGALSTSRERPDLNPDFVFQSKGRVTESGYEVSGSVLEVSKDWAMVQCFGNTSGMTPLMPSLFGQSPPRLILGWLLG